MPRVMDDRDLQVWALIRIKSLISPFDSAVMRCVSPSLRDVFTEEDTIQNIKDLASQSARDDRPYYETLECLGRSFKITAYPDRFQQLLFLTEISPVYSGRGAFTISSFSSSIKNLVDFLIAKKAVFDHPRSLD